MDHPAVLLDSILYQPDLPALMDRLRIRAGSSSSASLAEMITHAQDIARPKALYRLAYIDGKNDHGVSLDGIAFTSRVLRVNLGNLQRAFPYVATCGSELAAWAESIEDMLHHFWADVIMEAALYTAMQALEADLLARYQPGQVSTMNPGSLVDWPLTEQKPLFTLLGSVQQTIGVALTESMLMVPFKSVSGIYFATEETFASCQLCPRPLCPNRRALYDPALFDKRYKN